MASELNLSAFQIAFAKGGPTPAAASVSVVTPSLVIDVAALPYMKSTQNVGTADEALDLGPVTDIGFVYIRNLDAANFVEVGKASADYPIRIEAGEFIFVRWNEAAIHVKADTAAVDIEYLILSN